MAEQRRDVVYQDVLGSKDHGWPDDRVGQTGIDNSPFQDRFPPKVRQTRCFSRIRDADVHYALYTGLFSGLDQYLSILNSFIEGHRALRKANTVSIVKSC